MMGHISAVGISTGVFLAVLLIAGSCVLDPALYPEKSWLVKTNPLLWYYKTWSNAPRTVQYTAKCHWTEGPVEEKNNLP
jgi:hypothetical protein